MEYSSAYYLLAASVSDGTPCGVDTFNKCIGGQCVKAGCDHKLSSEARLGEICLFLTCFPWDLDQFESNRHMWGVSKHSHFLSHRHHHQHHGISWSRFQPLIMFRHLRGVWGRQYQLPKRKRPLQQSQLRLQLCRKVGLDLGQFTNLELQSKKVPAKMQLMKFTSSCWYHRFLQFWL